MSIFAKASPEDMISRAKTRLLIDFPFFARMAMRLPVICADNMNLGGPRTMATDGVNLFYYTEFVQKLTQAELTGVVGHEAMHVAWNHPLRRGDRDPVVWNIACDAVINEIVKEAGMTLPAGGVDMPKYKGWSAYDVYDDLMKGAKQFSMKGPNGEEMWGWVLDMKGEGGKELSEIEKREIEAEIKLQVVAAAEFAKSRGKLPGSLSGLIEAAKKVQVDWKAYIQQWVKGQVPDDYTWSRPNRSWLVNHGLYMPRMQNFGAGVGVLSIDTSGSVSDQELRAYVSEIVGLIEGVRPSKLWLVQHDAVIQRVDEWEQGEDFENLKITGRGGTCIRPTFEWIEQMDEKPDWIICFTDMGIGDYPQEGPEGIPVLWCATGPMNAPFGTYLPIKHEEYV